MIQNKMIPFTIALALITGCSSSDERLARMARDSVDQQVTQNREMSRLNREVADGVKQLVEADSQSRQELIGLQRDLQLQQAEINSQRDALDSERKMLSEQRFRESLLAPAITSFGLLVACLLPLVLCWYLLHGWRQEQAGDVAIADLLVEELVADRPLLLPHPHSSQTWVNRNRKGLPEVGEGPTDDNSEVSHD